ncbi:hypothetical protein GJV52_04990 [Neisseria brasiliensis]|uniref:YqcI/YcgG family protein n=1 Tax=Neisseria TaxID=482 RepID=UPI000C280E5C|nr:MULTISPECIES: YqcI/YcgG family protein [Neisseria]PJO78986.1 hypothetical protein CWC45_02375 [Neisseria sp. N177_16]QGL24938.1 hypothetical protein GJV52_04990 [Neisseria brasiliensis]
MFKFNYFLKQSELDLSVCSSWQSQAVNELVQTIQDEKFPCIFARRANDLGNLLFVFVDTANPKEYAADYELNNLLKGLIEYTEFVKIFLLRRDCIFL